MKLVLIFGSAAVGKMTVGQELTKITNLRLFHNHMTIEPVLEIFGEFNGNVIRQFRELVFNEFAKSDKYGMIFTYIWAFDCQEDWDYVGHIRQIFDGSEIYYVELTASQKIRLERNKTENRLKHKASKRNIEFSDKLLVNDDSKYRLVSREGEIPFKNYIRIDNSQLSAQETAKMIKDRFDL